MFTKWVLSEKLGMPQWERWENPLGHRLLGGADDNPRSRVSCSNVMGGMGSWQWLAWTPQPTPSFCLFVFYESITEKQSHNNRRYPIICENNSLTMYDYAAAQRTSILIRAKTYWRLRSSIKLGLPLELTFVVVFLNTRGKLLTSFVNSYWSSACQHCSHGIWRASFLGNQ